MGKSIWSRKLDIKKFKAKKITALIKRAEEKKLLVPISIVIFGLIGLTLLLFTKAAILSSNIESENGSKSANVSVRTEAGASGGKAIAFGNGSGPVCGRRVQNYNYQVPFGNAVWNQPVCNKARHPQSADYASRLFKWGRLNDGVSPGYDSSHGKIGSAPDFPKPTLFDPEGLAGLWTRTVYYASDATTKIKIQTSAYPSNLDGVKYEMVADWDREKYIPDTPIPWNPAWRTGAAGDNEIVILDESNGRIYGISGYKWDLAAVTQCGPFYRDRICTYHVDVGRDLHGNIIDYRTFEGFVGNRGVGLSYFATLVTPEEVAAGEIRHAMGIGIPNTATGPMCTKQQLGTSAEGKTCGTAVAPASKFEWAGATSLRQRCGPNISDTINNLYTVDKLIPEGMTFAIDIDDAGIENWINSRQDLKSNPRRAETARIFARAIRDYGIMAVDTSCMGSGIQTAGGVNPKAAAIWKNLAMGPEYADNLLDGLITSTNLYTVDPPTLTCKDGSTSKHFCEWTKAEFK